MRRLALIATACAVGIALLNAPYRAAAQPGEGDAADVEIRVIPLQHAAAEEIRSQIGEVADLQGIQLTVDHRTNCLILHGDAEGMAAIEALCEVVDTAPRRIDVELALYELHGEAIQQREITPDSLESPDNVRMIRRIRLQSLENLMTSIQLGEVVPVKTGEVNFGRGGGGPGAAQATYQMENLGTMVTYNSRVAGDSIVMELSVETTRLQAADEAEGDSGIQGKTIGVLQTTVSVNPGEPTIVGDFTSTDAPGDTRFVVLVTASLP